MRRKTWKNSFQGSIILLKRKTMLHINLKMYASIPLAPLVFMWNADNSTIMTSQSIFLR